MPERMLRVFDGRNEVFATHMGPLATPVLTADPDGNEFNVTIWGYGFAAEEAEEAEEDVGLPDAVPPEPDVIEGVVVETFKSSGRHRWYFRVRRGEIIAQSEGYLRRRDRDATATLFAEAFGVELTAVEA